MPARKSYNYYETGSTARKLDYTNEVSRKKTKINKTKSNNKTSKKTKTSSIVMILCVFSMALVLVYRYNVINEKNLESQSLANEITKAESALITSQIEVEQNTDLEQIEAYAKQKLGMQKPDKNQTIYVDTSKTSNLVELQSDITFIQKIEDKISNFINKIF